jgi:restriction endonuclease Mrr
VELAVLTNGTTWWFYLPTKKGDWKKRKFYTIDIIQQEAHDIAQKFIDLLSKENVQTGKTLKHAEEIYKGKLKIKVLEETLPEAWNKLISEPDSLLIDLLAETTEKICGFKPDVNDATRFFKHNESRFLLLPEEDISTVEPHKPRVTATYIPESKKLSQDELIPIIVKILQKHGGRLRKDQVEDEIYQMHKDLFKEPWYQETVSNGVPRWQHNIAWAKERGKRKGLIKRPDDSGRGYWELTTSGMKG